MTQHVVPSIATHVPVTVEALPDEDPTLASDRPDEPTPSLWQRSVKVRHKATGKPAIVHRVDWATGMFRAFYPDEGPNGRFAERTEWEHCRDWDVEVTFSPKELERQAAARQLQEEIAKLDETSMAAVAVLVDGDDPAKALAKIEALRKLGVVKASAEAAVVAVDEAKAIKKGR